MALNGLIAANNLSDVVDIERTWDNIGSNISTTVLVPSPTLDLNFAANKSLVDDISGNNLITFSRASIGTFVGSNGLLQTAASGVPRFDHNPTTGESLGLLVEEARTNLLIRSEEFNNAIWSQSRASITPNAIAAPDGAMTADKLVEDTANNSHLIQGGSIAYAASTPYTFSAFIKAAERFRGTLVLDSGAIVFPTAINATFDLSAKTITSSATGVSVFITELANGWFRLSVTATSGAGGISSLHSIRTRDNDGNSSYTGDGTSGFYIWGGQLEAGSFPTSYIPTVASTVTRAADVASITGANFSSWYNQNGWSMLSNFSTLASGDPYIAEFQGNGSDLFTVNANSSYQLIVKSGNVIQAEIDAGTIPVGTTTSKLAVGVALNNYAASLDGGAAITDTSGAMPVINMSSVNLFYSIYSSIKWLNGRVSRLTYYPVRLSNITLQALTTYGPVSSFPYSFSIKGRDILALKEVNKTSTRDFVFIKGLTSKAQPRINIASQYTASGVALRNAAMLKVAPTTAGNYFFSSSLTVSGATVQINGTNALSIATSPFSSATATVPLLFAGLRPQANWRFSEAMTSGTVVSPEFAIPIETSDFLLFIKAGQS